MSEMLNIYTVVFEAEGVNLVNALFVKVYGLMKN